jgi:hypothetical protein
MSEANERPHKRQRPAGGQYRPDATVLNHDKGPTEQTQPKNHYVFKEEYNNDY